MPAEVLAAFERDYLGQAVKEFEMEEYPSGGDKAYEIELVNSQDVDITYSAKGVRIKNTNED